MKDVCVVLKQGFQVKVTHRTDVSVIEEGTFDSLEIQNGEISGYNLKTKEGYLKFASRALFKIEITETSLKDK